MIAVLRGINVGGHRKVPMVELHSLAEAEGLTEIATYIQSGNLVFTTGTSAATAEAKLERAIEVRFGFSVDVIVRTANDWGKYATQNPFPDAAETRPNHLLLILSKQAPRQGVEVALREQAVAGERVALLGDALWIDYLGSVARSKLTPAVLNKAVGSPVTARNWTTVLRLAEMARP
jgi:uncharacterized protein (DUF1697 family)